MKATVITVHATAVTDKQEETKGSKINILWGGLSNRILLTEMLISHQVIRHQASGTNGYQAKKKRKIEN